MDGVAVHYPKYSAISLTNICFIKIVIGTWIVSHFKNNEKLAVSDEFFIVLVELKRFELSTSTMPL